MLFKYKVLWAAEDLLISINLFLLIQNPELQIIFSLFDVISNDKHPDWYFDEYLISDGLRIARKENLLQSSARLCEFIELSIGKGRRGPMPSLVLNK